MRSAVEAVMAMARKYRVIFTWRARIKDKGSFTRVL